MRTHLINTIPGDCLSHGLSKKKIDENSITNFILYSANVYCMARGILDYIGDAMLVIIKGWIITYFKKRRKILTMEIFVKHERLSHNRLSL
jgi:hypothetical protein